jgi:hypothetical protein
MNTYCPQRSLDGLCPELRTLAEAELHAGNVIVESGQGLFGPDAVLVLLKADAKTRPGTLPTGVQYREVNDPHWWKCEYFHAPTGHCLAFQG